MTINLKNIRTNLLNISQSQMAEQLGISQDHVSRLENDPSKIDMGMLEKLSNLTEMTLEDLLKFEDKIEDPILIEDPYLDLKAEVNKFNQYLQNGLDELTESKLLKEIEDKVHNMKKTLSIYGAKPIITFVGPSDAGKSRLINNITGLKALKSNWQPMTSSTIHIKHLEDKPTWMGSDNVMIFKEESPIRSWNHRKYDDETYCEDLKIIRGDYSVLENHCNRNHKGEFDKTVDSAIVYLDSSLLKACDIIDSPGFGTEAELDTQQAMKGMETADIVVFLCQSNGFLKGPDLVFLKEVLRSLPVTLNSNTKKTDLSNLFIVASQAHIIGKKDIQNVLSAASERLIRQVDSHMIKDRFGLSQDEFNEVIKKRFFPYTTDDKSLRAEFNNDLKNILETTFPKIRKNHVNEAINKCTDSTTTFFKFAYERYSNLKNRSDEVKDELVTAKKNKRAFFDKINTGKTKLDTLITQNRLNNFKELREWESKTITVEQIVSIIEDRSYTKKEAKEFLGGNISDLYHAKFTDILKDSTEDFTHAVNKYLDEVEKFIIDINKQAVGSIYIPFDVRGTVLSSLGGIATFGALSMWAASFGNLAGYILVAKGVSLLSALGISVGGTAAAASFVAAIGGPITIGVALALSVFGLMKLAFGGTWKRRLAKELNNILKNEDPILDKYKEQLDCYWNDSHSALIVITDEVKLKYDDYIEDLDEKLKETDVKVLEKYLDDARGAISFFQNIEWTILI